MSAVPVSTHRSYSDPEPKLRVVQRAKRHPAATIIRRIFVFASLSGLVYLSSSLGGNVLLEQARQDGKQALRRTQIARERQSTLQRQVNKLTSLGSIRGWARANGFVESVIQSNAYEGDKRVAINR